MSKITQRQLFFLIIHTQIGGGVLSLAFDVQEVTGRDSWISVLISGIFIQVLILLFFTLLKRFSNLNIFEISIALLGKFIGKIINFFYILFFIFTNVSLITYYGKLLHTWITPRTPMWVLSALITSTSIYLVRENLRVITRFFILAFFPFFTILFLSIYSMKDINILHVMPVGSSGILKILQGTNKCIISMVGFELALVFYPFVLGKKKTQLKTLSVANLFVTLFYTFMVFLCLTYFSPIEIRLIPEPVLYMIKAQSFKIIERTDLVFLSIWIIFFTTSFMSYLYASSVGAASLFNIKSHKKIVPYIGALTFFISLFLKSPKVIEALPNYYAIASYITIGFIPIFFLLISLFKKVGVKNK